MKRKILLSCLFVITLSVKSTVFAQNDEYYRPDSVRKERPERKEKPEIQEKAEKKVLPEKKEKTDMSLLTFKERLRFGGSFGLSFGTFTNVNLSPMAGYQLTEKLVGGVGATAMWFKAKNYGVNAVYYGGRGFLMYNVIPVINIIAEYETLNVETDTYTRYNTRKWINSPMFGASYSQPTGHRYIRAVHFTALYNVNYNNQIDDYGNNISPYGTPFVFRVTFL